MTEPPEVFHQTATPAQILERFQLVRERYKMGMMDARTFNDLLKLFQFRDVMGVLWTPGAQSGEWYRLNAGQWTPGNPPERLRIPQLPLGLDPSTAVPGQAEAATPEGGRCPKCGAATRGKKFCTSCGTRVQ